MGGQRKDGERVEDGEKTEENNRAHQCIETRVQSNAHKHVDLVHVFVYLQR